jgi:hypothetical protein
MIHRSLVYGYLHHMSSTRVTMGLLITSWYKLIHPACLAIANDGNMIGITGMKTLTCCITRALNKNLGNTKKNISSNDRKNRAIGSRKVAVTLSAFLAGA